MFLRVSTRNLQVSCYPNQGFGLSSMFRQLLVTTPGRPVTRRSSFDHFTEYVFDMAEPVKIRSLCSISFQDHSTLSPFPFQLVLKLGPGLNCVLGGDRKECIMICKLIQGKKVLLQRTQQVEYNVSPFAHHLLLATKHAASNVVRSILLREINFHNYPVSTCLIARFPWIVH